MIRSNQTAAASTPDRGVSDLHTLGNLSLFELRKIAFLCSQKCPVALWPKLRDWAAGASLKGSCVISGFHSPMEKELLAHLVEVGVPVILALASGLPGCLAEELMAPMAAGRLLLVTRYAASVTHPCRDKCRQRNRMMLEWSDEVVVGYASAGGTLERLCREYDGSKRFTFLFQEERG